MTLPWQYAILLPVAMLLLAVARIWMAMRKR